MRTFMSTNVKTKTVKTSNRGVSRFGHLEAGLKSDMLSILEFGQHIQSFRENPVSIEYADGTGTKATFIPDFYINYGSEGEPGCWIKSRLCVVNHSKDLKSSWQQLRPAFKAATSYAVDNGMEFKIFTEKHIRTQYLQNVQFLRAYREVGVDSGFTLRLFMLLEQIPQTTPEEIIRIAARDVYRQAQYLFVLWHMISQGLVGIDLTFRITMKTPIWSKMSEYPKFEKPLKMYKV